MGFIEFLVLKSGLFTTIILGLFIIKLLLSIEADLVQISKEISETNQELNKLINSLMNSLNDVRKLVNQRNGKN